MGDLHDILAFIIPILTLTNVVIYLLWQSDKRLFQARIKTLEDTIDRLATSKTARKPESEAEWPDVVQ